jgi:hypothetical protein
MVLLYSHSDKPPLRSSEILQMDDSLIQMLVVHGIICDNAVCLSMCSNGRADNYLGPSFNPVLASMDSHYPLALLHPAPINLSNVHLDRACQGSRQCHGASGSALSHFELRERISFPRIQELRFGTTSA